MSPAPRRRTRATGFSPGGPRELTDEPRRQTRGRRQTTAAGKAAPTAPARTADPMDLDKVDSASGVDGPVSPRRGRGQTRTLRARTRSSSPLESAGLPDNRRTRSPPRVADAARSPRLDHAGLGKGLGKHARDEDTLEEVGGPAEGAGGESSGSSVERPAKKLRAGDRGGEDIRRQVERENPPTSSAMTPSRVGARVLRAGASALKYLGFRRESPRSVAEGDVGESRPSIDPEVSSREAPGSTAVSPSGGSVVKSTNGPLRPDSGALASTVLHERSGDDLIEEQRRAAELRKLLKLGRRNVVKLKAPSECGSDDEEAAKAAYRFTEELRPVSLPTYNPSTRYVGWEEGNRGMLVVEEKSDEPKQDRKGKRTAQPISQSPPSSSSSLAAAPAPVSRFVSRFVSPFVSAPVSPSVDPIPSPSSSAAPDLPGPDVERGRKLVRMPILDANILTAMTTALGWFNDHRDTVPNPDELVGVLGKYRFDKKASTTGRTYRHPSPSDPYSDDEFESDTGEPIDRGDGEPLPLPRVPRRAKITARSVPDYTGAADAHLPVSYQGVLFHDLPKELQLHKKSWKIKQRDEIQKARREDRRARGIDEDDYTMGLKILEQKELEKHAREMVLMAKGKAENDKRRAENLRRERLALIAAADQKRARGPKGTGGPAGRPTQERAGRSPMRRASAARAPRCASLPRIPTISEETGEDSSPAAPRTASKIATKERERPFSAAPRTAPNIATKERERPSSAAPTPVPITATSELETPAAGATTTAPKIIYDPAKGPVPRRGGKKPRRIVPEWAGLEMDPSTHLPKGTVGIVYGVNYFSDSDDYSEEDETPTGTPETTATPAANAVVSGVDVDVGALVDSIPSHELKALFAVTDADTTDVDIASIVDTISRDDLEALIGIPHPSASDSRDNDAAAKFAISDDVMAMVEAIPDEMMDGILAGCSSAGPDMGLVGVSS